MTTVAYALGRPHVAAQRGGDCRARDLDQARNIHGPHRFAATTHCQISNGLLRLTVGASGIAPTLTVEAWRGRVAINDFYTDVYADVYEGSIGTPVWLAVGSVICDSPSIVSLLSAVRVVRISPEAVTIRLLVPAYADAFVTLKRGERMVRIQHGSTRAPRVTTTRQVRWNPAPAGTASTKRVEETDPVHHGFPRFVAAIDAATTNAALFAVSTTSVSTARFGAGVGSHATEDWPEDLHRQLADASRPRLVVA